MTITTLLVLCIGQISSAPPHLCSVNDITHILQKSTLMHSIRHISISSTSCIMSWVSSSFFVSQCSHAWREYGTHLDVRTLFDNALHLRSQFFTDRAAPRWLFWWYFLFHDCRVVILCYILRRNMVFFGQRASYAGGNTRSVWSLFFLTFPFIRTTIVCGWTCASEPSPLSISLPPCHPSHPYSLVTPSSQSLNCVCWLCRFKSGQYLLV